MADKKRKIKQLADQLNKAGYRVRFQKLKQGHGWRVSSNACTLKGEKIVFIDSRLSLKDQEALLIECLEMVKNPNMENAA